MILLHISCLLVSEINAAWDGNGSSVNNNATEVAGNFSMGYADQRDIIGFRITIDNYESLDPF